MTPLPGVLYGITHNEDGTTIIRAPKVLKVGIGLPQGRACNVWIHRDGNWVVRVGYKDGESKLHPFKTMQEARDFFYKHYESAPLCPFPRKTPYFTFTRMEKMGDAEVMVPDWEATLAHGPTPTQIRIVFTSDNPFNGAGTGYRMYSRTELRCKGDGINGLRILSMAATAEQKQAAAIAKEAGEKYFPITEGCWTKGCEYAKPLVTEKNGKRYEQRQCTPHIDLAFQLLANVRLGSSSYYHSTGVVSISNVFSALNTIKSINDGRLVGIPLVMAVRKFNTNHNGVAGNAYMVVLEPTPEAGSKLIASMMSRSFTAPQIAAPTETVVDEAEEESGENMTPEQITAEFIEGDVDDETEAPAEVKACQGAFVEGSEALVEVPPRSLAAHKPQSAD